MTTVFRPIPGRPDYEVSQWGDVRRAGGVASRGGAWHRILRPYRRGGPSGREYLAVQLGRGRRSQRYVHELVALAFVGPKPARHAVVHHIDENKANPSAVNLQWTTPVGNSLAAWHGWTEAPAGWSYYTGQDAREIAAAALGFPGAHADQHGGAHAEPE